MSKVDEEIVIEGTESFISSRRVAARRGMARTKG